VNVGIARGRLSPLACNSPQNEREFFTSTENNLRVIVERKERIKMQKQRNTSAKVARQSSKVLQGKGTKNDVKSSAASALSQRAPKRKSSR